jgi:hypothetical protein
MDLPYHSYRHPSARVFVQNAAVPLVRCRFRIESKTLPAIYFLPVSTRSSFVTGS